MHYIIHFKITKKGYVEVITQMYFPDHPLNDIDKLLQRKSEDEQQLMISKSSDTNSDTYSYTIIIEKA